MSRSLYRERGLKFLFDPPENKNCNGRSLYRERGLKYMPQLMRREVWQSLPLPGAWIEICNAAEFSAKVACRSLYRERGLKYRGGCRF